jgi:flavin-dependent dehydrogenase
MTTSDVVVIGGGPGGSMAATHLARAGYSVTIIEREAFPRFHIGESLLPASMPLFKETGFYDVLSAGKYIEKYGALFVDYQSDDEIYFGFNDGLNPDIPMAFEVPRADFDQDILAYAVKCGAELRQPERVVDVQFGDNDVDVVTTKGRLKAKFVIDCTGRDALLSKRMGRREVNKDLNNVAVFAHYHDIKRYPGKNEGDITIGLLPSRAWTWIIPFKGDRTSVGVVCSSSAFGTQSDLVTYMENLLSQSSRVKAMMAPATRATEMTMIGNYSHTTDRFFGSRWLLAGDSAVFLDPIFSSGVHVACSSGKFAAQATITALEKGLTYEQESLGERYQENFLKGARRFRNLIGLFYQGNFVAQMKKTLVRDNMRRGFTSVVAGDVWNDENFLFEKMIL